MPLGRNARTTAHGGQRFPAVVAAGCALSVALGGCAGTGANDGASQASSSSAAVSAAPSSSAAVSAAPPWSAAVSPTPTKATSPAPRSPAPTQPAPTQPAPTPAQLTLAKLSPAQRVGQVLMVGAPAVGPDAATLVALEGLHVGNVFLKGRSYAGAAAVKSVVAQLAARTTAAATGGVRQFVATDQEGGLVQILNGPGFPAMPSALDQGQLPPSTLQAQARNWGSALAAVGVNVNFGPVLDTVPSPGFAPTNLPIGAYNREYGFTPQAVTASGVSFAQGMAAAGVIPTVKHFPGLGRVTANTDTSSAVTDPTTRRNDPFVAPFQAAVKAVPAWVMVSSAYYPAIDRQHIAPFSPVVLKSMLREDLGFTGVIVSDDLCDAVQLSPFPAARRAADFIAAGGTMALCTNAATLPLLYRGMLARYGSDAGFARKVDAAALLVLSKKDGAHLLARE